MHLWINVDLAHYLGHPLSFPEGCMLQSPFVVKLSSTSDIRLVIFWCLESGKNSRTQVPMGHHYVVPWLLRFGSGGTVG